MTTGAAAPGCPVHEGFDPLVDGQRLSFHPNISFRGPQTLRVRRA